MWTATWPICNAKKIDSNVLVAAKHSPKKVVHDREADSKQHCIQNMHNLIYL